MQIGLNKTMGTKIKKYMQNAFRLVLIFILTSNLSNAQDISKIGYMKKYAFDYCL